MKRLNHKFNRTSGSVLDVKSSGTSKRCQSSTVGSLTEKFIAHEGQVLAKLLIKGTTLQRIMNEMKLRCTFQRFDNELNEDDPGSLQKHGWTCLIKILLHRNTLVD